MNYIRKTLVAVGILLICGIVLIHGGQAESDRPAPELIYTVDGVSINTDSGVVVTESSSAETIQLSKAVSTIEQVELMKLNAPVANAANIANTPPDTSAPAATVAYDNPAADNYVTPQMYGAVPYDSIDDTQAVLAALNSGSDVYIPEGIYLISGDLKIKNNVNIVGDYATFISDGGARLWLEESVTEFRLSNTTLYGVAIFEKAAKKDYSLSIYIDNVTILDTDYYGIYVGNIDTMEVTNSTFYNIGAADIDVTYQGMGIRVECGRDVTITNCMFKSCRGLGAATLRFVENMHIANNSFLRNDYNGIITINVIWDGKTEWDPNLPDYKFISSGLITQNFIEDCGVYASHNTGEGCSGIFGMGNLTGITVSYNEILNVCNNAIEGMYGIVEWNYVDGTGVDPINHPTPSASGINMYGNIYRYNTIKNTYLWGLSLYIGPEDKYYSTDGMIIEGNIIENSHLANAENGEPRFAIYPNVPEYTNMTITGNKTDNPLFLRYQAKYSNITIKDNECANGEFFDISVLLSSMINNEAFNEIFDLGK